VRAYTAGTNGDLGATLRAWIGMANAVEREALRPHLGEVRCPVRQLLGAAPHDGGPGAAELAALTAAVADYAVTRVEGAGHFLHEERPDAVIAFVLGLRAP
jgi:pimeloyl-ACP methyl ester carboxylesterase